MSDAKHTHAIYFGEGLSDPMDRNLAIGSLARAFRGLKWQPVNYTVNNEAVTQENVPVITGIFFAADLGAAIANGFRWESINHGDSVEIPERVLGL